jgi:Rrf2 family protein
MAFPSSAPGAHRYDLPVRVSARTDYAVRAAVVLATTQPRVLIKAEAISQAESIPLKYLLSILNSLRQAEIVNSQRGSEGGYSLARPPADISVADVIEAVEGPLMSGRPPRDGLTPSATGPAHLLPDVWRAVRVNVEEVLRAVTLADLAGGTLPESVTGVLSAASANAPRRPA